MERDFNECNTKTKLRRKYDTMFIVWEVTTS